MPDNSVLILAIDLGTSGPKVALVAPDGRIVAHADARTTLQLLPDNGAEQDPDDWWHAITAATRRVLAADPAFAPAVAAICCTSQWSGTVAVDAQGRHMHNAIIWMDARGKRYVNKITGGPIAFDGYGLDKVWAWIRRTGGIPTQSGKDSLAHILFIKHAKPDLFAATHKFLEPKDYLNLRLTGRFAATVDSITLHWVTDNRDIHAIDYDPTLLRMAGVPREKLPDLVRAVDVLGPIRADVAAELGVGAHVRVVAGTPDIHSATLGSGAVDDFAAHLYLGTSSWLVCHVPFKKTDLIHNMASLPAAVPGRYLLINEQEIAAGALAFLAKNLLFADDGLGTPAPPDAAARLVELAAEAPPGSRGLLFTPWLNGERSPVDDGALRGGFHNLALHHTRADLVRAVLEGVAFNSRWLLRHVEGFIKRPLPAVNVAGGGAQSDLWCQILADVFDRPIHQVADPLQVNTRGAGLLGAAGMGFISVDAIGRSVPIARTFTPDGARRELYDAQFGMFMEIYRRNRRVYGRVNG
jgi:xylulokinase